jgi:hypothetical protein
MRAFGQAAGGQQTAAQHGVTAAGAEQAGFDAHRVQHGVGHTACRQTVLQFAAGTDHAVKALSQLAQVLPEGLEPAVDGLAAHHRAQEAIGIGRERIGMHHQ